MTTADVMRAAKAACGSVAAASGEKRADALRAMAECISEDTQKILDANLEDLNRAKGVISDVMCDRLMLDEKRVAAMADGIRKVAALDDPVGRVLKEYTRNDGLVIKRISVPFGVVGIIYESRPNVTADAAALAVMSGNACVLRCGKEAFNSADAIVRAIKRGLLKSGISDSAVSLVTDTSRASANEMMTANGLIGIGRAHV